MYFTVVAFFGVTLFSSCLGAAYVDATIPGVATSNSVGKKVGTSQSTNVLGIVYTGDGGINKAAKDGGIKKISHVDVEQKSILGLFTTYKTIVYGD
ncbi:MAG: TRL-like family protein [Prevotella sp.]|nr:TRL-like family protein [Prevotella sp.]